MTLGRTVTVATTRVSLPKNGAKNTQKQKPKESSCWCAIWNLVAWGSDPDLSLPEAGTHLDSSVVQVNKPSSHSTNDLLSAC